MSKAYMTWAVLGLFVLLWPVASLMIAFALILSAVIAYVTLGPDRWAEIFAYRWERLYHTNPERAEVLRHAADRFAERFDRVLDRLPEAWADRLALPDMTSLDRFVDNRPDPFDRLASKPRDV